MMVPRRLSKGEDHNMNSTVKASMIRSRPMSTHQKWINIDLHL
jgi:hypothetical protein